jgi:hypothetical protein
VIGQQWRSFVVGCVLVTAVIGVVETRSSAEEASAQDGALDTAMSSVVVVNADDRSGAAFVCITNQWVATSLHVVLGTKAITVRTDDEEVVPVDGFCFADETKDLVLLHLEKPLDRKPLKLMSKLPAVGSEIYAIGNPHGLGGTVTKGIVSGIRLGKQLKKVARDPLTELILRDEESWVQFDAPIQPGNSGGPIVDRSGAVVGVVSRGLMQQDINFASPVVTIAHLSPQSLDLKPKPVAKMHEDCAKFWELVQRIVSTTVDTKFMWLRGTAELNNYFHTLNQADGRTKQINEEDERRRDWVQRRFANDSVARSIEVARCFDRWIVKHQTIFLTQLVGSDRILLTESVLRELYPEADADLAKAFQDLFLKTRAYREAIWQQHALFWDYVNAERDEQQQEIVAKCKRTWDVIRDAEKQMIDAGKVCFDMKETLERRYVISFALPKDEEAAGDEATSRPAE